MNKWRANPRLTIGLTGIVFFGLLNLIFKFHLSTDDFTFQERFWAHASHCRLIDVLDLSHAVRSPIFVLQFMLLKISPRSVNLFYFLFQIIHTVNSLLIYWLVLFRVVPYLENVNQLEGNKLALLAGLLFLLFPNNYEILYWRSCIFYGIGLSLVLAGTLWFSNWSLFLWVLSYVFYESFFFVPLILLVSIPASKVKKFIFLHALSLGMYALMLMGFSFLVEAHISRYPIHIGFLGINLIRRVAEYVVFHFSIRSSLKDYELLSWGFRALVFYGLWKNKNWISENKNIFFITCVIYLVSLIPVSLVSHFAPRGSFGPSVLFCLILALILLRSNIYLLGGILGLFALGHILGAMKANDNSLLYESRFGKIKSMVTQLPDNQKVFIEIKNFDQGYRKEWFLQAGFSLKLIENELKYLNPSKDFNLVDRCPESTLCHQIDFLKPLTSRSS